MAPDNDRNGPERPGPLSVRHLKRDLASRSISGGVVTLIAQGIKVAVQVVSIVLLARLLSPDEFGLFAIVLAFLTILELFKDMGLSGATVQRAEVTHRQLSTLFWLNAALGVSVAALFACIAPGLAWFYDEPVLRDVAAAAALTMIFTGFSAQHLALLRRQMRFKALSVVQTGSEIVALGVAVTAAASDLGIWALVFQRLTWGFATLAGSWLTSGWRPGRPGRLSEIGDQIRFGTNATGAMLLGRFASSADKMAIGWLWGVGPLGLFERSQKLTMMPVVNICTPLASVALPMLSRLVDEPDRYRTAYQAVAQRICMLTAPVSALVFMSADTVTAAVLGEQWSRAAPILSWLGLSLMYAPLTYTLSWLYMSQDRTPEMLRANMANVGLNLIALAISLPLGPVFIAMAYALGGIFARAPFLLWYVGRKGPVGFATFLRILALPVAAAALSAGLIHFLGSDAMLTEPGAVHALLHDAGISVVGALLVYLIAPGGRRMLIETLTFRKRMMQMRVNP
ncbi:MAG: lipopolysaccharide biosynthesis protein [Alphaproteobacteria bacterium]|nr:lipopolysaccharide biosynthesis protein [Alphaproteobacteria bacterium]